MHPVPALALALLQGFVVIFVLHFTWGLIRDLFKRKPPGS